MKKLTLILILVFTFQVIAQDKSVALKFDEFSDFPSEKYSLLRDRTERFGKRMKKEPKSKNAAIIYYNSRKGKYPISDGREFASHAANILGEYEYLFNQTDRIVLIDGGYREYPTLEFWVVPKEAELPKPNPTFTKDEVIYCPNINLAGDGFRKQRNEPLKFSVSIQGEAPNSKLNYDWNISAGKIISGQNSNQIEIDLSETDKTKITASLIVKGLPTECNAYTYHTTQIGLYPYKLDEFPYIPYSDLSARMDAMLPYYMEEPASKLYVIIYESRDEIGKKGFVRTLKNLQTIMTFRNHPKDRIIIVNGGYREEMMVEVYLLPNGVEPPKATPTLNTDIVEPNKKIVKKSKKANK
jgi:hypothetical protein